MTQTQAPAAGLQQRHGRGRYYLWRECHVEAVHDGLFEPQSWAATGRLTGRAGGRGTAWFLHRDDGTDWVLRHSRRGGAAANVSHDAYLWLGRRRCRVFREFRLLAAMRAEGLPVPEPVAARVIRHGFVYSGDLITVAVPGARPLADKLAETALDDVCWRAIGATIARFHRHHVHHHDLNARNILLGADDRVVLIDFDKSRRRTPGRWCSRNLSRLRRSLHKIACQQSVLHFTDADWAMLHNGYDSEASAA